MRSDDALVRGLKNPGRGAFPMKTSFGVAMALVWAGFLCPAELSALQISPTIQLFSVRSGPLSVLAEFAVRRSS